MAVVGTAAVTGPLLGVRGDVSKTNVVLAYLLVVTASAAAGGLGRGILAAALGFLAFDFLFLPPYHTLAVNDRQDYLSLGVYLLIAVVVSLLVGTSERRRMQAERREQETRMLFDLSSSLVTHASLEDTLQSVVRTVRSLFGLAGCAIVLPKGDGTRLVHNLLDISRIEAGALAPRLTETSVAEVVGPMVRRARAAARQRVDVDVPDTLPPVLVDPVRLDQVLTNLLDNARGYAAGGPIQVSARQAGANVEVRVIDHGPGIPAPERERVFDQFYRLKGGGKRPEGTGMGLAICRGIVQAHGGNLRVETTPGGGATFVLSLPAVLEDALRKAAAS